MVPSAPSAAPGEAPTRSGAGPTDAALVVAARAGEAWAREALFRRYARTVNGIAFRLLGRDDELDDLVQDCFVQALRSLDRLNDPSAFGAWLSSLVVRTTHKRLRRRQIMRRLGLYRPRAEPIDVDAIVSTSAPPDAVAQLRALYTILESLPAGVRVPLVLHRVEGEGLERIAELVGVSLATVKRRIAEGERALTLRMEGSQ